MSTREYDVIIIGGGPAGLSAGIYTARSRRNTLLIEKDIIGGNIVNAEKVENYPGFPDGISGYDLTQLMYTQTTNFGMETVMTEITGLQIDGKRKIVTTGEGDFSSRVVIIAGGSLHQKLGAPGEIEFTGRGVSYCATCDAAFFTDQPVAVVGGGNAAIQEAIHLTRFASSVNVIHRRAELRATRIEQERAFAEPKIKFVWNSVVIAVEGKDVVDQLRLRNTLDGKESTLDVKGVFVAIGFSPNTAYLKGIVPLDDGGYVTVDNNMATSVPGIFAAGDIRSGSARQVVTACGDGATAAINADKYIEQQK
jgi:thioredoxin reductase (NADPH)